MNRFLRRPLWSGFINSRGLKLHLLLFFCQLRPLKLRIWFWRDSWGEYFCHYFVLQWWRQWNIPFSNFWDCPKRYQGLLIYDKWIRYLNYLWASSSQLDADYIILTIVEDLFNNFRFIFILMKFFSCHCIQIVIELSNKICLHYRLYRTNQFGELITYFTFASKFIWSKINPM